MILAIDIGNTNLVLGGYEDRQLCFTGRCESSRSKTVEEYAILIHAILRLYGCRVEDIEGGILGSVVPPLRAVVCRSMELLTGKQFMVVGAGIKTGLDIRMDFPGQLGSDLVVDAVAALARYPKPIIVYDMGTATTLSVIDRKGCYLGGMIIPGLRLSVDALAAGTAQLPSIILTAPGRVIGRNTVECMQAGAVYGCAALLDGLTGRVEEELGEKATAVATGDLASVVVPHCARQIHINENLQLEGLCILYYKNLEKNRS